MWLNILGQTTSFNSSMVDVKKPFFGEVSNIIFPPCDLIISEAIEKWLKEDKF